MLHAANGDLETFPPTQGRHSGLWYGLDPLRVDHFGSHDGKAALLVLSLVCGS
jgi:hypothetical protein